MLEDLAPFAENLAKACLVYRKFLDSVGGCCPYPVKTRCGHLHGMPCLHRWIQKTLADRSPTTCPYCRTILSSATREKPVQEMRWQVIESSPTSDVILDTAPEAETSEEDEEVIDGSTSEAREIIDAESVTMDIREIVILSVSRGVRHWSAASLTI